MAFLTRSALHSRACVCARALHRLRAVGFTPFDLKLGGFVAKQLREIGLTADELVDHQFTALELREGGYPLSELKKLFAPAALRYAMFTCKEMRCALPHDLPWLSLAALFCAGHIRKPLPPRTRRARAWCLRRSYARAFSENGFTLSQLKEGGFAPEDLRGAGYYCSEMKNAGFTISALKTAGCTLRARRGL